MVLSIDIFFVFCGMMFMLYDEIVVMCLNEIYFYNIGKFGMNRIVKCIGVNGMVYGIVYN